MDQYPSDFAKARRMFAAILIGLATCGLVALFRTLNNLFA